MNKYHVKLYTSPLNSGHNLLQPSLISSISFSQLQLIDIMVGLCDNHDKLIIVINLLSIIVIK